MKIFHAAHQDLEIFFKEMGSLPLPLFDTQIAAMVLGHGERDFGSAMVVLQPRMKITFRVNYSLWGINIVLASLVVVVDMQFYLQFCRSYIENLRQKKKSQVKLIIWLIFKQFSHQVFLLM